MATTSRVVALDVLRGVAIVCMLIAHGIPFFWTTGIPDGLLWVTTAINDVASPLFGLAMGAAAALVWARPSTDPVRRGLTDVGRGVVVYAIGMLLVELNTWVAIVLHVLGMLMIIGVPVAALAGAAVRRPGRRQVLLVTLTLLTVGFFIVAPWVTGALVPAEDRLPNGSTAGWPEIWVALMAGRSYRAVSLLPFFGLGAVLAASGLLSSPRRLAVRLLPIAAVLVVALLVTRGFGGVEVSGDHSDQLRDLTLVITAVAGVCVLVLVEPLRWLWQLLARLGAIALSLYALQLLVLWPLMRTDAWHGSAMWGWAALLVLVVVPSVVLVTWRRFLGPGPLERVVALVTGKGHAT